MSESLPFPRICQLTPQLANQIAAGEVIERPSSVVKELLENSLDAGATRIKVEISQAGTELIRVSDNGHGLHPDDMELALQRHATAKLDNQSDLAAISSLGFRGEALPSISSVATFSMTSRIAEKERGVRISFDPRSGESQVEPAAHPVGTTVEVSRLFENTPARRKFLRTERTEFLHIQEIMRRLALSRFNFFLQLEHNGKHVFSCHEADKNNGQRVAAIMGQTFSDKANVVDQRSENMRLWGWLGSGDLARSSTDRQYLYLNGRMIQDKRLNHAIRVACEGEISEGRFPSYVLHLQLDYSEADVNVHPAKHEVRFRQARDVHDFVCAAVSRSMPSELDFYPVNHKSFWPDDGEKNIADTGEIISSNAEFHSASPQVYDYSYSRKITRSGTPQKFSSTLGTFRLQISNRLVLLSRNSELVMLDLEQAHRCIAEFKFCRIVEGESLAARPLLVPVSFELNQTQYARFPDIADLLREYSLEIELSGPASCRVRMLPYLLSNANIETLLFDIFSMETTKQSVSKLKKGLEEVIISHLSDIPQAAINAEQVHTLVRQLGDSGLQLEDKQNKPIWTTLSDKELLDLLV
ncbi:MAG: DNA mismatch repair endonuclease MutL [Gammaproteobacteria bacterium]|nr:DNA mismatch repair endonuclease MutL [Gammaproteobacteria bacterium]